MHVPQGSGVQLAGGIKANVRIPVFAAGRIMNAAQAEGVLAEGQADGVEMIRALIADPNLPRLSQEGRAGRVRPCISCNQGCQVRGIMNAAISCNVNPDVLHAQSLPPEQRPVRGDQRVYVVGGGPAGLEAARTAPPRGRRGILYGPEATPGRPAAPAADGRGPGALQPRADYA